MIDWLIAMTVAPPSTQWWFAMNLLTGAAYLHIPMELRHWTRGRDTAGMHAVTQLFVVFIAACGFHHIVMLTVALHHPAPPRVLAVDTIMAIASVLTSVAIAYNRGVIRDAFGFLWRCWQRRHEVEDFLQRTGQ